MKETNAVTINEVTELFQDFKKKNDSQLEEFQNQIDDFELRENARQLGTGKDYGAGRKRETEDNIRAFLRGEIKNLGSVGSDPKGGYSVDSNIEENISQILRENSPIRTIAGVSTFSDGDAFEELFAVDGAGASWVSESGARGETTLPDMKKLRIPVGEIYSAPRVTQRLIEDSSINILNWMSEQIGTAFAEKEDLGFVSGIGGVEPRGFLTYPTETADDGSRTDWPVLQHKVSGNASGFGASGGDVFVDLIYTLKAGYRQNAVWIMNRKTAGTVRKFKDGQGNYLWQQSLQAGDPSTLLGHEVVLDENMPDVAANALPVAFGNFNRGYKIVEKPGVKFLNDPFTEKPNVILYSYKRVGGDVRDFNAIKLLKIST